MFSETNGAWMPAATLTAGAGASPEGRFGVDVAVDGDSVLVGADRDFVGDGRGAAFLFERDAVGWSQRAILTAVSTLRDVDFGQSVALSGAYALIGSPLGEGNAWESGTAFLFKVGPSADDCGGNGVPDECEHGDFDGSGCIDPADIAVFAETLLGLEGGCLNLADVNDDQAVDGRDIAEFVADVLDGCV